MAAASLQSHDDIRCLLEQAEESLASLNKRIETMEAKQQQQHKKIRAALKDKEKETEAINERINEMNKKHQKIRLKQMEQQQLEQNHQLRSALDQQEKHLSLVKESFKQITNLQQQKHTSIRSELDEEEERLRSSNVNRSTCFQTMTRLMSRIFCCCTNNSNCTGNQNPSNEIECDHEDQHHAIRSALEQEKENLDSLETRIKQIEEIQRQEDLQLTSALQPDEKQSQLQREDIKTANMVSLQKRVQILQDFQKHLNKRSSVKEEKLKLLVKRLDQIKNFFQQQHKEARASVEEKETDPLLQRIEDMKNKEQQQHYLRSSHKEKEIEDLKQIINEKDEQLDKLIRIQEKEVAQLKHKLRSLKDKEKETEDLKRTINEKDEQLQLMKSASKEKQKETEVLLQRVHEMEEQLQKSRSALTQKEDEHKKLNQRFQALYQQQNHNARSLKDKEKETEALKRTINEKDDQIQLMKSGSGKQTETEVLLQRVHEMEAQLQISRSALQEKDEQLKSFKDRVAGEVALSIKTGNTMSLNNPVNKNRLKEMYEDLRCDWPKVKKNLKSNNKHPDSVKELILKEFREAKIEMRNRRMMIDKVFENVKNAGGTPQKVDQYRQLTVQNLQMTLYNEKQDAGSQKPFLENQAGNPQDVLEYLGSECYWLGCLMALNNPPLQPDWENHPPSMDRWDFFPRNIRNASENE